MATIPSTTNPNKPTGVTFTRTEVECLLEEYVTIRDALEGEKAIKRRGVRYLPDPSSKKCDADEKTARYADYLCRAVFYNATRRTLTGLTGFVFTKSPEIEAPGLEAVVENAAGDGVGLIQQMKKAVEGTLAYSRAGLLVDFSKPLGDKPTTKADEENGSVRATVTLYEARDIRNWRIETIGSEDVLQLLVLREEHEVPMKGSEFAILRQYWFRELRLVEGRVVHRMWRPDFATLQQSDMKVADIDSTKYSPSPAVFIAGSTGEPLDRIPFFPIGLTTNGWDPEPPAFYDLASLNLAHYRNSADYEEACFVVGQVTPFFAGVTKTDIDNNGGSLRIGARGGIAVEDASAKGALLQAQANVMVKDAMDQKERQMVALGAKLVQEADVQRTATEAKIEETSDGSTLQSAARNVSAAYTKALNACYLFTGGSGKALVKLNDDFDIAKLNAADRAQLLKEMQAGSITWTEHRAILRRLGAATQTDEEAKAEVKKDEDDAMKREVDAAKQMSKATGDDKAKSNAKPGTAS